MTSPRHILAVVFVGALLSTGLAAAPAIAAPTAAKATGTTQSFYVKKSHTVTITLKTAADGGYEWVVTKGRHDPTFEIVSKKVVFKKGQVGGYAKTVYVLRTTAYGVGAFKAIERRPFDKSDVIDSFTLHLHVTKSGKAPSGSTPLPGSSGGASG